MKLEPVVQSEVTQKGKNKYCVLKHIYIYIESRKMVLMNLFAGQEQRCRLKEQPCGYRGGRRGWDELREQRVMYIEICTLPYIKQIADGKLLDNTGSST